MGSSLEWHFPFSFLCVKNCLFFFVHFLFFCSPLWFFLFLHVIYACLHTVSIKSRPLGFFLPSSVTVIFTSSLDALTMQPPHPPLTPPPTPPLRPSSFNHMYSFSTLAATIVCRHRGIHGNLGTKSTNPLCLVVMPDSNTKSHNSTITHRHTHTNTPPPMYYNTTAMARFEGQWRRLRGPSQLCSLHFKCSQEHIVFFVAIM